MKSSGEYVEKWLALKNPPNVTSKVVFLRRAESRLTELALYITSEAGIGIANGYVDRIYAACMALAEFPERGRSREDILPGLRTITMERRVTIAYRVRKKRVEILTIAYAVGISRPNFAGGDRTRPSTTVFSSARSMETGMRK
jgi:toxin ParE1/3/4